MSTAEQLALALVPAGEALAALAAGEPGRKTRWERQQRDHRIGSSRWGAAEDKPYKPPPYVDLPAGMTADQLDQFLREQRLEELQPKVNKSPMDLDLELGDADVREPSPPPTYDRLGSRTNTREMRIKQAMHSEYQRLIEYMTNKLPSFITPHDFRPQRRIKKIVIPLDKYPDYNFMGLLIGPRGCNHKRLEAESGCQIAIRGKGTLKEGKRTDHQTEEEANMPMHVHISADTDQKLDKAISLIEPLLDPGHPMHEEFKKAGLEQLAVVNGFLISKTDMRCSCCNAVGHQAWECPDMQESNVKRTDVKCAICGDKGHPTADCKWAQGGVPPATVSPPPATPGGIIIPPPPPGPPPTSEAEQKKMDKEYEKMMRAIEGREEEEEAESPKITPLIFTSPTTPPKPRPTGLLFNPPGNPPRGILGPGPMGARSHPAVWRHDIRPGVGPTWIQQTPVGPWGGNMHYPPVGGGAPYWNQYSGYTGPQQQSWPQGRSPEGITSINRSIPDKNNLEEDDDMQM
eukprot:GHVL01010805.1.p1 GENE.GHVL01010805.1~~GHVL01010805.1.p1  ORF type:complete len:516 (-),score=126.52 GHVL01010805.1:122-1669(-)